MVRKRRTLASKRTIVEYKMTGIVGWDATRVIKMVNLATSPSYIIYKIELPRLYKSNNC